MNREQQIAELRKTLAGSSQFRRACESLWERFEDWPQKRPDVADFLADLVSEANRELRPDTAALIDRLIRSGILMQLADGALIKPTLPLEEILGVEKRQPCEPLVIKDISASKAPAPAPAPEADPKEETEEGSDGLELSEIVLAGLHSVHLERKGGVFNSGTVALDLRNTFREWRLSDKIWRSRKAIQRVINDCFDQELIEGVEEGYWRLTERGLAEAKSAYDAWHRRLDNAPSSG